MLRLCASLAEAGIQGEQSASRVFVDSAHRQSAVAQPGKDVIESSGKGV
jgi:hypothetical protein